MRSKSGCGNAATWRVAPARNRKDIVHAAIGGLAHRPACRKKKWKPRFAHRPIRSDEKGNVIRRAGVAGDGDLWVRSDIRKFADARAAPALRRLRMATAAAVRIEGWPKSAARFAGNRTRDGIHLHESRRAVREELNLGRRQRGKIVTSIHGTGSHPWVARRRSREMLRLRNERRRAGSRHPNAAPMPRNARAISFGAFMAVPFT